MSMSSREAVHEWALRKVDPVTGEPTKTEQQKLIALARVLGWETRRVSTYPTGAEDVSFESQDRSVAADFHMGYFQGAFVGHDGHRRRRTHLEGLLRFLVGEPCTCPDDELAEMHEAGCALA